LEKERLYADGFCRAFLALISVPTFDLSFLGRISGFNVNKTIYFL